MSEIRFYHLQNQSMEEALPALLGKAYENGHRIIVKAPKEHIARLNDHLWTYRADSFLPHGAAKDGNAEHHPIWLTDEDDNPNNADLLILTHNLSASDMSAYKIICEIFDGRIEEDVAAARARWKEYKDKEYNLTYWQQSASGGWEKKA
ncbi:MAG: DNA polymerase III subunit chi [Alphaproteobacteria bacterium]